MVRNTKKNTGSRRLVLLDAENLAGNPVLDGPQVVRIHRALEAVYPVQRRDLVYVGGHVGNALPCGLLAKLTHGSICLGRGRNAADLALISRYQELPRRAIQSDWFPITECVIGSGDHDFCRTARQMKESGLAVTVVARAHSLSRNLAQVADRIILIDRFPEIPAVQAA